MGFVFVYWMLHLIVFGLFLILMSVLCTTVTLYLNFQPVFVYFILYGLLIVYMVENWEFNKEITQCTSNQIKVVEMPTDEKVKFLLTIIKTLTIEIQQLKDIISIIPNQERMRRLKATTSIDFNSL